MNSMKLVYLSLFSICLFVHVAAAQQLRDEIKSFTKVGDALPAFSLTDTDGKKFGGADLQGKVLYVNFWATWCPPCLEEFPRVEKEIWAKYKASENFAMVAIAREETEDEIISFRDKYKYTFPIAADPDRAVYKLFGDGGIPRSYVVGADGKILFQSVGYNPAEFTRMVKLINHALNEKPKKKPDEPKAIAPEI